VDFLPDIGIAAVVLWLLTYGFGEEVGWRGYLLPRLQRGRSAWRATLILWVVWAIWHVPSFFYLHTVSSAGTLVGFLLGVLAGAILLTWLYNSCGGSVLIVAVWHGLFDYVTACTECKSGLTAAALSTVVMIWAVVVIPLFKPANLSRQRRQIL
jgi:membrane protease YdiL (CAAX protease family)